MNVHVDGAKRLKVLHSEAFVIVLDDIYKGITAHGSPWVSQSRYSITQRMEFAAFSKPATFLLQELGSRESLVSYYSLRCAILSRLFWNCECKGQRECRDGLSPSITENTSPNQQLRATPLEGREYMLRYRGRLCNRKRGTNASSRTLTIIQVYAGQIRTCRIIQRHNQSDSCLPLPAPTHKAVSLSPRA